MKRVRGDNSSTLTNTLQQPTNPPLLLSNESSLDAFLQSKLTAQQVNLVQNGITRLKTLDPQFGETVKEIEMKWIHALNNALEELVTELRKRITLPTTSWNNILEAIELLGDKLDGGRGVSSDVSITIKDRMARMDNTTLDTRIIELQRRLNCN